jgi:manganese transport protein
MGSDNQQTIRPTGAVKAVNSAPKISVRKRGWMRRLLAFVGPAYLVSVGYMDPGNWATDIEGGARFGYMLIWVLLMSNLIAVLLQTLSARLGIVTGHDLAQGCRREYPRPVTLCLWVLTEVAIAATDLAEALGTIVGLNLLFHIPLLWGCAITALDTFLFLVLQHYGVRKMEAFIVVLVATIGGCFLIEVFLAKPDWGDMAAGLVPRLDPSALYIAIGIIGATVMPHNLYLHSSLVQSRAVSNTFTGKAEACRYNLLDSLVALNAAFFVNAAILVTAAADFYARGIVVTEIQQAHQILDNVLGHTIAPIAFAVALVAAGQSSTITGTISGQVVMEGFLNLRMAPWLRRLVTRLVALAPAVIIIAIAGNEGIYRLLVLSQVILSLQLPFAIVPLIHFTADQRKMGPFANSRWVTLLAWVMAVVIIVLNVKLVVDELAGWLSSGALWPWLIVVPVVVGLTALLIYLVVVPWIRGGRIWDTAVVSVGRHIASRIRPLDIKRIGAAVEHAAGDSQILSAAIGLAKSEKARLVLIHVVDAPGVLLLGSQSASLHATSDETYLEALVREVEERDLPVESILCFGRPAEEIVKAVDESGVDMLVMGSHGHGGVGGMFYGETVTGVHHNIRVPLLVVPSSGTEPALHSTKLEAGNTKAIVSP